MVQEKQRERAINRGAGKTGVDRSERNRWCKRNKGREQQTEGQEKQGEREVRKIHGAGETKGESNKQRDRRNRGREKREK